MLILTALRGGILGLGFGIWKYRLPEVLRGGAVKEPGEPPQTTISFVRHQEILYQNGGLCVYIVANRTRPSTPWPCPVLCGQANTIFS